MMTNETKLITSASTIAITLLVRRLEKAGVFDRRAYADEIEDVADSAVMGLPKVGIQRADVEYLRTMVSNLRFDPDAVNE